VESLPEAQFNHARGRLWIRNDGHPSRLGALLVRTSLPRYIIGALGLVWDEQDRLLLGRQSHRTPGWALPGGGVYSGESLEACLRREMAEELDWAAEIGPAIGCMDGAPPDHNHCATILQQAASKLV
jgi:ADP-ribose pyrophosphatase YjhB (NUDIX family)